jgi:hypothetical protein
MIRLIVNRWNETNARRKAELDLCARKNAENPHLEVVVVESQDRPTYATMIEAANARISSPDDISIIANADIYFDDTIRLAVTMDPKQAYALRRWNVNRNGSVTLCSYAGTDSWVFRGHISGIFADMPIGTWATDVRLNAEIAAAGYTLLNPARSIKSYHVHASGVRNYPVRNDHSGRELRVSPHALGESPSESPMIPPRGGLAASSYYSPPVGNARMGNNWRRS